MDVLPGKQAVSGVRLQERLLVSKYSGCYVQAVWGAQFVDSGGDYAGATPTSGSIDRILQDPKQSRAIWLSAILDIVSID